MFRGLYLDSSASAKTTNPNITGDLTVVVELWKEDWTPVAQNWVTVWDTSQRSWIVGQITSDELTFQYSTDGSAVADTVSFPIPSSFKTEDFAAFKVEFDSDPGTITFYAAETKAGPWTSLGSHSIGSITALFSSTADLVVGQGVNHSVIKAVEVYSGISTSIVVNAIFENEVRGTTTFIDVTSNSWTLSPNAAIVDDRTPNIGLWLPDSTDLAKEWAKDLTQELNELNVKAIDAFVGIQGFQTDNTFIIEGSAGGTVDLGSGGTKEARWVLVGDLVIMSIDVLFGSSPSLPDEAIHIHLPVGFDSSFHNSSSGPGTSDSVGEAHFYDNDLIGNRANGVVFLRIDPDVVAVALIFGDNHSALWGNAPFSVENGDSWNLNMLYKKVVV